MAARKAREPDPPQALRQLERSLEENGLARGYVLRGEERYFRDRAAASIRRLAEKAEHEICVHDADRRANPDFRLNALIDDLSGGGLFSTRRFVLIKNPEDALKKVDGKDSPLTAALRAFVASSEDPGTVVLVGSSLRADNPIVKAIKAAGGPLLSLRKLWDGPPPWNPDPRQAELVQWLVARAREVGVRLAPNQAVYVCAATGNDLFALEDQLERLRTAPGESVGQVVDWNAATTPWSVSDELLGGRTARAVSGIEALFRGGFQEKSGRRLLDATALASMLIGSLMRGVRQGLALRSALDAGRSDADAAKSIGLAGRAAAPALERAKARPSAQWRRMLEEVLGLDRRAKSAAGVDANDFSAFALRWRTPGSSFPKAKAPARS